MVLVLRLFVIVGPFGFHYYSLKGRTGTRRDAGFGVTTLINIIQFVPGSSLLVDAHAGVTCSPLWSFSR